MNFVPMQMQCVHLLELNLDQVFAKIKSNVNSVEFDLVYNNKIKINLDNSRYKLFAENPACICCGIIGNRLFLDEKTDGGYGFCLNLYAETRFQNNPTVYAIQMIAGMKVMPEFGGSPFDLDNLQTLCYNCYAMLRNYNLTVEQVKSMLFTVNRLIKSSYSVRKTNENLTKELLELKKYNKTVSHLEEAFAQGRIKDDKREMLLDKIHSNKLLAENLEKQIRGCLLKAQTTGSIERL